MPTFPLPSVPTQSYSTGPRRFGAPRSGNRLHAGCDLIAAEGTEIRAVEDGVVVRGPYPFHHGTHAVEVRHGTRIVRMSPARSPLARASEDMAAAGDTAQGSSCVGAPQTIEEVESRRPGSSGWGAGGGLSATEA